MNTPGNYIEVNRALWNARTKTHLATPFYKMDEFLAGESSLNSIELDLLGDIKGKSILHLQCHFGQDSLSLARMGAVVTGVDLSDEAINTATALNSRLGLNAEFICANIYDLPQILNRQFDIVFTSYGTICWLPDLTPWAAIIAQYLAPGGSFIFAEFHPALWMFDNHFKYVQYSYFNRQMIEEIESGTYADQSADINLSSVNWNHDLGEVLQSLLKQSLSLISFEEFDYSPYPCFPETVQPMPGKYQLPGYEDKLPMVFALKMRKTLSGETHV
ncbi:MAG: class I SAM-dependent methyltransferase [Taibaiella sp.]|nr:class I SAM-dependent methyltransferase [Taibaiella sp.]